MNQSPHVTPLHEGLEIMLDELGVTIDELDAQPNRFMTDAQRRAWLVSVALREEAVSAR